MVANKIKSFQIDLSSTLGGDFNVTSPVNGEVLTYSSGQWVNSAGGGGGGAFTLDTDGNLFAGSGAGAGLTAGSPAVGGAFNFLAGHQAGTNLSTSDYNVFVGYQANGSGNLTTGNQNVGVGHQALFKAAGNVTRNVAIGYQSAYNLFSSGVGNVCIGPQAGYGIEIGSHNICLGNQAGSQDTTGTNNTNSNICIGQFSGTSLSASDTSNVLVGSSAGAALDGGSTNVCIGHNAGSNLTGASADNNVCLGPNAGPTSAGTLDTTGFKLYINASESDTPLIFGDFSANEVTINGDLDATGNVIGHIAINAQTGTTYELVLTDDGKLVTMDNASANTLTIPADATVDFPIGTQILVSQEGAGTTSIANSGSPALPTLHSPNGALDFANQYTTVTLIKKAANTWLLVGDLI
jgi:hypothetical protein